MKGKQNQVGRDENLLWPIKLIMRMLAFGVWWRGLLILHPRIRLSHSVWDGSRLHSTTASGVELAPVGPKAWRSRDVCCQRGGKKALNWACPFLLPNPPIRSSPLLLWAAIREGTKSHWPVPAMDFLPHENMKPEQRRLVSKRHFDEG